MTQPKSPHNAQAATLVAILAAMVLLVIAIGVSAKAALGPFPGSADKDTLLLVADFVVDRDR